MKSTERKVSGARRGGAGFTLVEVVVAMGVAAMVTGGIYQGLSISNGLNHANEQRVVAFGLCMSRLEMVKGMEYEEIGPTVFGAEPSVALTHLGGIAQVPISGTRTTVVRELANPERKEVVVALNWTYRGTQLNEQLTGLVYPK